MFLITWFSVTNCGMLGLAPMRETAVVDEVPQLINEYVKDCSKDGWTPQRETIEVYRLVGVHNVGGKWVDK